MLAKKVTEFCGTKQINWGKLQDLYFDLVDIGMQARASHITAVYEVLDTPAQTIINTKSKWIIPMPFTYLLPVFSNHESTDIRDKVYALLGLSSDSTTIRVDYDISPKALLVELIYHACSSGLELVRSRNPKANAIRFAKEMTKVLKVHCDEDELMFHI
jgi:hypothetical protein